MAQRETFGEYTAIEGKLSTDDARAAYVTGPAGDGVIRPIASFWSYADARRYARNQWETAYPWRKPSRGDYSGENSAEIEASIAKDIRRVKTAVEWVHARDVVSEFLGARTIGSDAGDRLLSMLGPCPSV